MKRVNNKLRFICVVAAVVAAGCANADGYRRTSKTAADSDMYQGSRVSSADLRKHADDRSATIVFAAGSYDLSSEAQAALRDLIAGIGSDNVSRVEIAAWSDKVFPKGKKDLLESDQDLAEKRAKQIDDFLNDNLSISNMRIRTYNMAETSNWLARVMKTDEAELKSVFSKQTVAPMERADFNVIAREGAPMKAVVVVVKK